MKKTFCSCLLLLILLSPFMSCVSEIEEDEPDSFSLGENDYALACNPEGNDEGALACQLAYYTNRERAAHPEESDGATSLDWDWDLADVADEYSEGMCDEGFFSHDDQQGREMEDRLKGAGIHYVKAGENLARGTDLLPGEAMAMFMNEPACEPNHRGNVLDNDFTHTGVGVAFCGGNAIYTQLFATFDIEDLREDGNEFCGK